MVLCVTGPMAAGKNEASLILESKGFATLDADATGHTAVENAKEQIMKAFGSLAAQKGLNLLLDDGRINRRAVGQLIFGNKDLVAKQESIVYPEINRLFDEFLDANKDKDCVLNAAVLYKVPAIKKMDHILFVDAPFLCRLYRAHKRDHMKLSSILSRFNSQKGLFSKYKKSSADIKRVWNIGTREQLERKIDALLAVWRWEGKSYG